MKKEYLEPFVCSSLIESEYNVLHSASKMEGNPDDLFSAPKRQHSL